jgi:hypothetical protein
MTTLLAQLEKDKPDIKSVMMHALSNISPTHLFDRDLQRAWEERGPSIPAKASLGAGRARERGPSDQVIVSSTTEMQQKVHLPMVGADQR